MKPSARKYRRDFRNGKQEWVEYGFTLPALFDDFVMRDMGQRSFGKTGVSTPAVNIIETNDDFRFEMVAPGMRKEAFNVSLQNNVLTVSYDHADNREGDRRDWTYMLHEYNYHSFERSFHLPEAADGEKIQASYTDGILNLIIPKKEEARKKPSRRIEIQ